MDKALSGRITAWALVVAILVAPVVATATTVVRKSFAELCDEADLVFVGTVSEIAPRWRDRERMEIETRVAFTDVTAIRGAGSGEVSLLFAGGELDGIREEIAGMPRFTPGQRVVILAREGSRISPIVGFHQGCFQVVEGPAGPVVEDAEGRPVTGVEEGELRLGAPEDGPAEALPLQRFLSHLREQLDTKR